jgi:hypothetical protein
VITPAKIVFELPHVSKKHVEQGAWKTVAAALIDGDITQYYSWFIYKRFGLKLIQPLRRGHVTFISDRTDQIKDLDIVKEKWHNQIVEVQIALAPRTDKKYWWLRVSCPTFDEIRTSLGLGKPFYDFHLTLGYTFDTNLSSYILEVLKNEEMYMQ